MPCSTSFETLIYPKALSETRYLKQKLRSFWVKAPISVPPTGQNTTKSIRDRCGHAAIVSWLCNLIPRDHRTMVSATRSGRRIGKTANKSQNKAQRKNEDYATLCLADRYWTLEMYHKRIERTADHVDCPEQGEYTYVITCPMGQSLFKEVLPGLALWVCFRGAQVLLATTATPECKRPEAMILRCVLIYKTTKRNSMVQSTRFEDKIQKNYLSKSPKSACT